MGNDLRETPVLSGMGPTLAVVARDNLRRPVVTLQPHDHQPPARAPFLATPEKNPRAIRAALLPEDAGNFDREYRAVMTEAMETLDLTPLVAFIERWWRVAWSSADPEGHRDMLDTAERLLRGEAVSTRPIWETLDQRGL
ncbi:DUF6247 family protein [Spongiactinospora sp. TRM90649]|uniref:DUF6247 family protein n=1 Tax=Spongiactinospora sp. TRM90649 TaxID=3031114 RepID=UPI0023F93AEF|nr:DUF6247 family protein [Spongiactinospora sp. TRM90649]MDF5756380.1 DUF6247 family protein [Spongiactinospora sp. TRM90649]